MSANTQQFRCCFICAFHILPPLGINLCVNLETLLGSLFQNLETVHVIMKSYEKNQLIKNTSNRNDNETFLNKNETSPDADSRRKASMLTRKGRIRLILPLQHFSRLQSCRYPTRGTSTFTPTSQKSQSLQMIFCDAHSLPDLFEIVVDSIWKRIPRLFTNDFLRALPTARVLRNPYSKIPTFSLFHADD
jgi:hypothetical protein